MTLRLCRMMLLLTVVWCSLSSPSRADLLPISGNVQVAPAALKLTHHRHEHSLIVSGKTADGIAVDLSSQATLTSADPTIADIENGWVKPLKSGQTQITVQADGQTVQVPVVVELPAVEKPFSFRHEVMPVLSKGGCNAGAC
ncbi:MAG: hypothetical protein FD138_2000, partial [Planctomycetota bacterium]